jgi:hypothetical protein
MTVFALQIGLARGHGDLIQTRSSEHAGCVTATPGAGIAMSVANANIGPLKHYPGQ